MKQVQIEELKNKLIEEKERLEKELSSFAEKNPKVKGDWTAKFPSFGDHKSEQDENADEVEEYIAEVSEEHILELRLKDVDEALEKIGTDAYGKCSECSEEIPFARLQANPEAKTCIEHAK